MNRAEMISRIETRREPWDFLVIGGGATGAGIALDAAARGYDILLLEQSDFGKGTSSRSTKLIHGGVRYLQQGNIALVMDALKERGCLRDNAPHLVRDMAFVVPNYDWWEAPFYGIGLKVYDLLAGRYGFGPSKRLSKQETLERIPNIRREGLRGGIIYHDGQFDDARLLINLIRTAANQGATLINYAPVTQLIKDSQGFLRGVGFTDTETGLAHTVHAKVVINATGPFIDRVRRMDDPSAVPRIAPSQGIHLVFDKSFLPGKSAIMVPHTRDGRVMFAIPYLGATLVGTTDTPIDHACLEPRAMETEIAFILETAGAYLEKVPTRQDILSMFAGIRPLVNAGDPTHTATLSRDHTIDISRSGLVTIAGGKWTTYRQMAEDCLEHALALTDLPWRPCVTRRLNIHGFHKTAHKFGPLALYGADAPALNDLIDADPSRKAQLHPDLPTCAGEVIWAVRFEAARTVDDFLARRTRCLLLNARAARQMAPRVAALMAKEMGCSQAWQQAQVETFLDISRTYVPAPLES